MFERRAASTRKAVKIVYDPLACFTKLSIFRAAPKIYYFLVVPYHPITRCVHQHDAVAPNFAEEFRKDRMTTASPRPEQVSSLHCKVALALALALNR